MENGDGYIRTIGWWCRGLDEKEYGPYSLKTIRAYYSQGIISADTQVRHNTDDEWQSAGDMAEITADSVQEHAEAPGDQVMPSYRRMRDAWRVAAEGEVECIKHKNRKATRVCHRCHAPICEKDVYRHEHWMCKSCHSYLYNRRTFAGLLDYVFLPWSINLGISFASILFEAHKSTLVTAGFLGLSYGTYMLMAAYWLFKDFLFTGRSLGKILCAIRVVDVGSREPCVMIQSIKRNALLGANWIPLIGAIAGLWWMIDVSRAWYEARGRREFDKWAGTMVIDMPQKLERARQVTRERVADLERRRG